MLPKNGHSVEKKYFLYSIIKIYDVNYYLKHRKNIFCNLTIFELVNVIEDFESLCFGTVSPFSMFPVIQPLFLQKTKPLYSHPKYLFGIEI